MDGPVSPLASPLASPTSNVIGGPSLFTTDTVNTPGSVASHATLPDWTFEEEEFWWACQDDDLTTASKLLQQYPSMALTTPNRYGVSPLYAASFYKSNLVLSLLLTSYHEFLDIDQQNDIGCGPLHACCMKGNLEGVKLLLKRGADPHLHDNQNITPIAIAEHHNQIEISEYMAFKGLLDEEEEENEVVEHWICHICTKANVLDVDTCVTCGRLNAGMAAAREAESQAESERTERLAREARIRAAEGGGDDKSVMSELTEATHVVHQYKSQHLPKHSPKHVHH